MTDTRFYYASDHDKYRKFKLDLELVMKHKQQHCAPALEKYWAQEVAGMITRYFTDKAAALIYEGIGEILTKRGEF